MWLLLIAIAAGVACWFLAPHPHTSAVLPWIPQHPRERAALVVSVLLNSALIVFLARHASTDTLLSPWQLLPEWVFFAYGISVLGLFVGSRTQSRAGWFAFAVQLFVTSSVAACIYQLGYGFDGFIHRTTIETIIRDGVILPRTPYYIGAYMLEFGVQALTHLRLFVVDQWLVPVATALAVPLAAYVLGFRLRIGVLILALPCAFFITTTPQAVGLLLLILALAYANSAHHTRRTEVLACVLALAACAAHPVAGIPALIIVVVSLLWRKGYRVLSSLVALGGSLALPVIFIVIQGARITWAPLREAMIHSITGPSLMPGVSMQLQFSYTYLHLILPVTIGALVLYSIRVARNEVMPYVLITVNCLLASLLLHGLTYQNVISYEQSAFGDRLFVIALIACTVPVLYAITTLATRWHWDRSARIFFALLFATSATASWYLTYPRVDVVDRSKGYSTSAADFETVATINRHASDTASYIVLTNQAVSAAAIAQLGFHPTVQLNGAEQFIYPVPTGGPLYPYYLKMVYDAPTRTHALEAATATNVDRVYLVITPYWHNARQLIEVATREADDTFAVGANRVFIFQK